METLDQKNKRLKEIGRIPINPLIFWGVVSAALTTVLLLIVAASGYISGIHWLIFVPVFAYLVIMGLFLAYISRLQRDRDQLLADRLSEESHRSEELKKLNQELESYAKQLFDKDIELTMANKRLQSLEQAKSKFVAVTTHQLRTPLSAIKWTFHMMMNSHLGPVTDEQKEFLRKGYASTQRTIMIINDLLNVDYIEAEQLDYNLVSIDIVELVENIMFEFTNQAKSRNIELKFLKPTNKPPAVMADPVKIGMVLENLIDNAVKYTPVSGHVTVHLSDARINSARPGVEIIVSDSGIGIPTAERDKLFHRFFRGSNAIHLEPNGTGLGLFIARDVIEKHGGELWFESKEGSGSNFHFTLPLFTSKAKT